MVQSSKTRKQRKAFYNAPAHIRRKMVSSHLSDELRKDFGIHAAQVVKGDTVRVMRGDEDVVDVEGKVTQVDTRSGRLVIENVTISKADGTLVARPIHASKVEITKLNLSDPMRKQTLSKKEVSQ
ncbi:50S ribosomal protein L24 [Candidatus Methanomassiliicoccus intestinalis]|uniref:Large ribosomal subunit protein uL24 n=2 Tax=Candidatus Methanomassiliicoccus intestinalis TaxID=1406512 RepID=R9T528_METII|nr:50S ribosomal protein L24 [Candidatus Methanomassiliicoccus intestinalis]AGN25825.1 50S ribosomal protein L24P [Candidatus Methanomassiliicoccus intestinalis Issoire-Mx1]TQS81156.1 MAG: 50S ribosomal protein L24 [Candidatus Methanomassiliicoccus intestinalis]TQS83245.1 MAG: 50S ribosomal protein L24 [Candidatus Methanomassiliicoccus intestinalis]